MALRHRQEGGHPLPPDAAFMFTAVSMFIIVVLAKNVWFPLFASFAFTVPYEMQIILIIVAEAVYLSQSMLRVPIGKERAQLWMGRYTGISYPAGICFVPALPLPFVSFILKQVLSFDINAHLWWTLEGDVEIASIPVDVKAEGLTSDGVRVSVNATLVFEVTKASTYLSQTKQDTDRSGLIKALSAEVSAKIKEVAISNLTAEMLFRSQYSQTHNINELISILCKFEDDFGVELARSPVTEVTILNERIREAFDSDQAKALLRRNTNEYAEAFKEFRDNLPIEVSDEIALAFFNTARANQGQSPVTMNMVKFD